MRGVRGPSDKANDQSGDQSDDRLSRRLEAELGEWLGDFPAAAAPVDEADLDDLDEGIDDQLDDQLDVEDGAIYGAIVGVGGVGSSDRGVAADEWQRAPASPMTEDLVEGTVGRARSSRSDAGTLRLTERDVDALLFLGEMYGCQSDQLEQLLATSKGAVRQVTWRWRKGGLVETVRLGPGPQWCYLTRRGLELTGLGYSPRPPSLARLRHIRAVVAVRLTLEAWPLYREAGGRWRSERRLRAVEAAARPGVGRVGHVPDGEILWRTSTDSTSSAEVDVDDQVDVTAADARFAGQVWAVEVELTPKTSARTAAIMAGLLSRTTDYGHQADGSGGASGPRYSKLLYLVSNAARATVEAARAGLPAQAARRVDVRPLPADALTPTTATTSNKAENGAGDRAGNGGAG